jgi:hypothetical protein
VKSSPYYQLMEIFSRGFNRGTAPVRWLGHDVPRMFAAPMPKVGEIRTGPDSARHMPRLPDREAALSLRIPAGSQQRGRYRTVAFDLYRGTFFELITIDEEAHVARFSGSSQR